MDDRVETLQDYVRIKEAARLLGVSAATIRNWGRSGKIKIHRHPLNDYRLFKRADIEDLITAVKRSAQQPYMAPPSADSRGN